MLLKKIKLKNIRSYLEEEITFPLGTSLLSGDIGSGKSTILLALDFALFGIRRGELSGNALLRNGCQEGYVNLNLEIHTKNIFIKRTLKKSATGITQESGYLTINDVTEELTPGELKQRILTLLHYPQELLTKKLLIYRYTVYTPQEEMKLILLGDKEHRLETLRKVFNIDKYKRIKENAKIFLTEVKQKKKEHVILSADLELKKIKIADREKDVFKTKEQKIVKQQEVEGTLLFVQEKKASVLLLEEQIKKLQELKKDYEIGKITLSSKEDLKLRILNQITLLEKQLLVLKTLPVLEVVSYKEQILEQEKTLELLEKEVREVTNKKIELRSKKNTSEGIKKSITALDFCPLCKQQVSLIHKEGVLLREGEMLLLLDQELLIFIKKEEVLTLTLKEHKEKIQVLRTKDRELDLYKLKLQDVGQKEEQFLVLKKELLDVEGVLITLTEKNTLFKNQITQTLEIEEAYKKNKNSLDLLLEQQKKSELQVALLAKEEETLGKEIIELQKEIELREKSRVKVVYYTSLQDFIENFFINLIELTERKVMLKVHTEFNLLFQKWFEMLMNIETLKVRLDEEFTPIIEQNDHDLEYENLSGGEKTACALAYRLALNKVINTLSSSLATKDLIILDEPTDGFSSEQLDKVRSVLEELEMKQVILVSHESKIESFVDTIIKIQKQGHVSKVLS